MATIQYVVVYYPGSFFCRDETIKIDSRENFTPPPNCVAYKFYDREEVTINGELLVGKNKNYSEEYHVNVVKPDPEKSYTKINVRIYPGGGIDCLENCRHSKECANHESAGDFRHEDGFTPDLMFSGNINNIYCSTNNSCTAPCLPAGALVFKLNNNKAELVNSNPDM